MKIVRPGNTEFNLLFAYFCEKYCNLSSFELTEIYNIRQCYTDWIYKTAGYYDSNVPIKGKYIYPSDYTNKLNMYIEHMAESLRKSDIVYCLGLEWMIQHNHMFLKYLPAMEDFYNIKLIPQNVDVNTVIPYIINKKVLVISPFKELIDIQVKTGNLDKIQPILSNSTFLTYKFPYTFLNTGPHRDSFETLEYIKEDIKNNYTDFDVAILSCGSYGTSLADFIHTDLQKDTIYIGGQLPLIFGIIGKRDKWAIKELYNNDVTYLINDVPLEFRPDGWDKIEDGCYW